MSDVWIAQDERLDREIAVKLVTSGDPDERARVLDEARTIAAISDPHVVTVHDAVEEGNDAAVVMELVHGGTLADRLRTDGRLPWEDAVAAALEIATGLAAAHDAGLVHRDVKPSNVLIRRDGSLAVADFGIAGAAHMTTNTTTIRGSLPYVAPEQIEGRRADPRTDVYALGCMLTAMITGAPPFTGEPAELLQAHLHQSAPRLRDRVAGVPAALDDLVARMLEKDPAARPTDMHAVRSFLTACQTRADPQSRARGAAATPTEVVASSATPAGPPRRSLAPALAAIAGLAVGLLLLGAWSALSSEDSADTSPGAPSVADEQAAFPPSTDDPAAGDAATEPADPQSVEEAVAAFRRELDELRTAGEASDAAVEKLGQKATEVLAKAAEGKAGEAAQKVEELGREVDAAQRDGDLTSAGADALRARLEDLQALTLAAADAQDDEDEGRGRGEGQGNGNGNGNNGNGNDDSDD